MFNRIKALNSKRVKMLKDVLKSIDRFWSRLIVDQADKLYFFIIRSECDFSLYSIHFFSSCDVFYSFSKFHHLRARVFKKIFIRVIISIQSRDFFVWRYLFWTQRNLIADRSCFIYREYDLKKFSVETDLRFSIALSERNYFNKQFV